MKSLVVVLLSVINILVISGCVATYHKHQTYTHRHHRHKNPEKVDAAETSYIYPDTTAVLPSTTPAPTPKPKPKKESF